MKGLKIIGLGIGMWGLSLLWPAINLMLTLWILTGLGIGLVAVTLLYDLYQQHNHRHYNNGTRHDHPSRPIPPIALAR